MSLLFVGKVVYVLSSVGPQQMKIVIKAVQDGGGSVSTDPNDESITHVICGNSQVSHAHLQSQFGGLTVEAVVQVSYFPRCKKAKKMLDPTEPEFAVYISVAGVVESTPPAAEDQVSSTEFQDAQESIKATKFATNPKQYANTKAVLGPSRPFLYVYRSTYPDLPSRVLPAVTPDEADLPLRCMVLGRDDTLALLGPFAEMFRPALQS